MAAEDARNKFGDLLHLIARAWVSRVWSQDNEETKMLYAVLRDVKLLLAFELLEWPSSLSSTIDEQGPPPAADFFSLILDSLLIHGSNN